MVDEFVDRARREPSYPPVVFVHQGSTEQGQQYFGEFDTLVRAIADPTGELYSAFRIERGGMREMFGLRAWRRGIAAFFKGHFIGRKVGDAWTLPTLFLIDDGHIVWEHRGAHAGDHPDVDAIAAAVS
jgi:hypothetical protein